MYFETITRSGAAAYIFAVSRPCEEECLACARHKSVGIGISTREEEDNTSSSSSNSSSSNKRNRKVRTVLREREMSRKREDVYREMKNHTVSECSTVYLRVCECELVGTRVRGEGRG